MSNKSIEELQAENEQLQASLLAAKRRENDLASNLVALLKLFGIIDYLKERMMDDKPLNQMQVAKSVARVVKGAMGKMMRKKYQDEASEILQRLSPIVSSYEYLIKD